MMAAGKVASCGREITVSDSEMLRCVSTLWISWNTHRRTTGLSAAWDIPLHVIRSERNGLRRWIDQLLLTLSLLRRQQAEILFVQNPSLALTVLVTLARPLFGYSLIVDAHNEGVRPFHRPGAFVGWLTRYVLKRADATIVTNTALAKDVTSAGGRPLVLPDRLPEPPALPLQHDVTEPAPHVVVIATFWGDEPIAEIMAAAATMPEVRFAFTGDTRRFASINIELPENVRLTGFLQDAAYWPLLAQAVVVCDLTLKPDCLVCGAYEALAVGKPMVLSDNSATREIFGPAAVLTGSTPDEIARAVSTAIEQREQLAANARGLRKTFQTTWQTQAAAAWNAILAGSALADRGSH